MSPEKVTILNLELLDAVKNDSVNAAKELLNAGAYPNAIDSNGKASLHYAAMNGNEEILELLIEAGASVDQGIVEITDLGPEMTEITPLDLAAWKHHYHIIEKLIFYGADINICDLQGNSLLIRSIIFGDDKLTETLLRLNADINLLNFEGKTALHYATIQANRLVALKLIEKKARITRDSSNQTALDYGARNGMDLLIKKAQKDVIIKHTEDILKKIFLLSDEEDLKIDVVEKTQDRKKSKKKEQKNKNESKSSG